MSLNGGVQDHLNVMTRIGRNLFVLAFVCLPVFVHQNEGVAHFSKNGLAFNYPATMKLDDLGTPKGQHLVLVPSGGGAQIMIMARYAKITSEEQLATARREVVDAFVENIAQELQKMDPKLTRTGAEIEIAGRQATGVRLQAVLNSEPGVAHAYSLLLGRRLVLVTLIGCDKEIAAGATAWAMIRNSLRVESVD